MEFLQNEGCNATTIANSMGCSKSTIYKKLYELNMPMRAKYSQISNEELKTKILNIHEEHPNAGQTVLEI